jgi:DNA-binding beta-propeller fold protein YncE
MRPSRQARTTALTCLFFLLFPSPLPPAGLRAQEGGPGGTLVVVNKGAASASIVDVATGRTIAVLPTGEGPHEVAISSDGRTAVVTDYGARDPGRTLTVLDVPGVAVLRTIDLDPHLRPHGIAFLPGDREVAVTSEASGHVLRVDVASGEIREALATEQAGSHMLALPSSAARVWTSNAGDDTVTEIDLETGVTGRILEVPPTPEAIGVTPDGAEVWVGSNSEGTVSVIDAESGSVTRALEGFAWPYRTLVTGDARLVLIPDLRGERLVVVDREGRRELRRLSFPGGAPQGVAVTADGRTAFLSLSALDRVAVVDLESGEVVGELQAGRGPDGLAWSPLELDAP